MKKVFYSSNYPKTNPEPWTLNLHPLGKNLKEYFLYIY
jgi:hypothetical protein